MSKEKKSSGFSLKDHLFNRERIQYLADLLKKSNSKFDSKSFVSDAMKGLKKLELKARIVHLAECLEKHLASEFKTAAKQIVDALPPPLDPKKTDDDFGDFIFAPFGEFVVRNGLEKKHLKVSLRTIRELTQRFSMEDAIRAFIDAHTNATMDELEKWAKDKNYHVRRLVSEGTRAMLPWSKRLSIDILRPLPLLEILHADSTRYVTRSVANHLNDIAKTNPKKVLKKLKHWKKLNQQEARELEWMSKHALRTLVKQGNPDALSFLGYKANPKIEIKKFSIKNKQIKPGDVVEFSFEILAERNENLMVDYVIDFVKANGGTAPKVHKLKQLSVDQGTTTKVSKKHLLKADATTYTLYPGIHKITLRNT